MPGFGFSPAIIAMNRIFRIKYVVESDARQDSGQAYKIIIRLSQFCLTLTYVDYFLLFRNESLSLNSLSNIALSEKYESGLRLDCSIHLYVGC